MSPLTQHFPLLGRFGYIKRKNKHVQNQVMIKTYCCLPTWTAKPFLIFLYRSGFTILYHKHVNILHLYDSCLVCCVYNLKWEAAVIAVWCYTEKTPTFLCFGNIQIYCWIKSSTFVLLCRLFFHPMGFWAELMINAICLRGACIFHISL